MAELVLPEGEVPEQIVLHSCCAPCSAAILEWLENHNIKPIVFFYNPNIFPAEEYTIRKNELLKYTDKKGIEAVDADYDHQSWLKAVKGLENEPERGLRCAQCFKYRLAATALFAREREIAYYTTTLAGSRWKRQDQIEEAALAVKELVPEVNYWNVNWRKGGLQQRRGELLKLNGFYNQQYCGCEFSMRHLTEKISQGKN